MVTGFFYWGVDPEIVDFGFISLRWYSILFALGFIFSYRILTHYFKQEKAQPWLLDKLTIYVVVGTVIGARLGHCLFYDFDYYSHHILEIFLPVKFEPQFHFTGFQGLASHGGAVAIFIALIIFSKKYSVPFFWILDRLALVIPIAGFMIRLGNLMNSEMIGKPTDVKWAFVFERVDLIPRHPGQLYEAIFYLLIFISLNVFHRYSQRPQGFIFGLFLVLLFSARFIVEFFKEEQVSFEENMILNMGQLLSIPFIALGMVIMIVPRKNRLTREPDNINQRQTTKQG
jgi:phosphatidylglycerol:prolipoprotein diacylglycerol transferase